MNEYPISKPNLVWPIFDAIYPNAASLNATDSILIGRFVLIKYSNKAFPYEIRKIIEAYDSLPSDPDEAQYYENYLKDDRMSKDRVIYQKQAVKQANGQYIPQYIEICRLNEVGIDAIEQVETNIQKQVSWNDTYLN